MGEGTGLNTWNIYEWRGRLYVCGRDALHWLLNVYVERALCGELREREREREVDRARNRYYVFVDGRVT
jgi:hypothetical protein